jgi:MFS family permease
MQVASPTSVWRTTEFLKLWIGGSISAIGSQITMLAMPLIAVLTFGAGPGETGLLVAAGIAPHLVLGLPAGAWIDRLRRRPVRIVVDLAHVAVMGSVPLVAELGLLRIEYLYVVAFVSGTLAMVARLTTSALIPTIAGPQNVVAANTAIMTAFCFALIAGPALAGWLVQVVSPPTVLLLDAAGFLVSAAFFIALREPDSAAPRRARSGLREEIGEGFRWLRGDAVLLRLTLSIGLANLAWYAVQGVMVPFATHELQLTPAVMGLAVGAIGPAGLLGSLSATLAARRFGFGPTMVGCLVGELLSRILLVLAGGPPVVAALVLGASQAVFGFIAPLFDVNANSLRQLETPQRLFGRVSAASNVIRMGMAPIGALIGAWIGEAAGPRATLAFAAFVTLGAVWVLANSPVLRLRTATSG